MSLDIHIVYIVASAAILASHIWWWGEWRNRFVSFVMGAVVLLAKLALAFYLGLLVAFLILSAIVSAQGYGSGLAILFIAPFTFVFFLVVISFFVPRLRKKRLEKKAAIGI